MRFGFRHSSWLLPAFAGAAACHAQPAATSHVFVCDQGKSFLVRYAPGRAIVTTEAGRWTLTSRPSSIGRRFSSDSATFIHDEDRAALNGLPGGPFRRCREGSAAAGPGQSGAPLL